MKVKVLDPLNVFGSSLAVPVGAILVLGEAFRASSDYPASKTLLHVSEGQWEGLLVDISKPSVQVLQEKTREEIDDLKRQWKDSGGDFYIHIDGSEDYTEELNQFEEECERQWQKERDEQMAFEMRECGLDWYRDDHKALFGMLMRMKYRLIALESRIATLEKGRDEDARTISIGSRLTLKGRM